MIGGVWMIVNIFSLSLAASPKIAIIGAGIGGSSCSHFLRQLYGDSLSIDVFEADTIGGRLATTKLGQYEYEIGGAIVHPRNKYMVEFLPLLHRTKRENADGFFGLFNGKKFLFSESQWSAVTIAKLFVRYGLGPYKLDKYIDHLLDNFSRIYDLQKRGIAFKNVSSLLEAMSPDLLADLLVSTKTGFSKEGFSDSLIQELVMATLTCNYGQDTSVHKFVGSVSVAGASGGLWAVRGGNKVIAEELLKLSSANVIPLQVLSVTKLNSGQLQLSTKQRADINPENTSNIYDKVILATPQTKDSQFTIQFNNFEENISFKGEYHRTVCTLVRGVLNESYFLRDKHIDNILITNPKLFYNSVSRIFPVGVKPDNSNIWKVFSKTKLSADELSLLFTEVKEVFVKDWLAYPHYNSARRDDSFVLDDNLYHINAIEWAASAMEMSVIGAKNVALLAYGYGVGEGHTHEEL